jgi:hypothetical protein
MESMKVFQENVKSEMSQLKGKIGDMEKQILDLKVNCNSKINGEEVKDIIDKKLNLLQDYRRDTEIMSKKYAEMT